MARMLVQTQEVSLGLEEVASLAETTVERVRRYLEQGLLGRNFGEAELYLVRRIERLRLEYGVPSEAAGIVLDLAARVEELENEIRSLREGLGR